MPSAKNRRKTNKYRISHEKVLKIFLGVLFAALLVGTFVFLWQKTRPVKIVYAIEQPKTDTLRQYVVATGKVQPRDEVEIKPQISGIISTSTRRPARRCARARSSPR